MYAFFVPVPKSTFRSCFATCHPDANFIIYSLPRRDNMKQKVWDIQGVSSGRESVVLLPDRLLIPLSIGVRGKPTPPLQIVQFI